MEARLVYEAGPGWMRKTVAVLDTGAVVDPEELAARLGGEGEARLEVHGVPVEVGVARRGGRVRAYAVLPGDRVAAIVEVSRLGRRVSVRLASGGGRVEAVEETVEHPVDERHAVRVRRLAWYYLGPGGLAAPVYAIELSRETLLTGRPLVVITVLPGRLLVHGDVTPEVRAALEEAGLRWGGLVAAWFGPGTPEDAERLAKRLEELGAEVKVEDRTKRRVGVGFVPAA